MNGHHVPIMALYHSGHHCRRRCSQYVQVENLFTEKSVTDQAQQDHTLILVKRPSQASLLQLQLQTYAPAVLHQ